MKILICGDVVGRSGREVIEKNIPIIRKSESIDFVVVNGENAANGFGITKKMCENFYSFGVDVITTGNHVWDQKEIVDYINSDKRLLRPSNYPKSSPGSSYGIYSTFNGVYVAVVNIMCRLFMDFVDDPFESLNQVLNQIKSKYEKILIIVDVHGEATSEKMAIGHFLDGKVAIVFGTHTHIPTADLQILEKGTFYQTDLGMCGDYNSVVGMKKELSLLRFKYKHIKTKLETANGEGTMCGSIIEIDKKSLFPKSFKQIKIGGQIGKN